MESDKKLVAYEQAVKAYQFQVERYNTWMNYYSLFVGALFVSFYMIICYSKNIDINIIDPKHLLIFIAALGIIASICWMASLIGNCTWMNSYIRIVKEKEENFFGPIRHSSFFPNLNVYRYISADEYYIEMRPGFISTQKITEWFVGAVLTAWIFIFLYYLLILKNIDIYDYKIAGFLVNILLSLSGSILIYYFLKFYTCSAFSCNLRGMIHP